MLRTKRSVPARKLRRVFAVLMATTIVGIALPDAMAQTPPAPAAPQKPAAAPKKPPAKKPGGQPAQPAPTAEQQQQQPQVLIPPLIFRRWTRVCPKDPAAPANAPKQPCFVFSEGRDDSGVLVVRATVLEVEGDAKKAFILSFIYGVDLQRGTRVIIDQGPMTATAAYVVCVPPNVPPPLFGCVSQYEINNDVINGMKKGKLLTVQTIFNGQTLSPQFPLENFAQAYDGPPTDLKAEAEQEAKLQEELRKRAIERQNEQAKKTNPPASK